MKSVGSLYVNTVAEVVEFTEQFILAGVRFTCGREGNGWLFEFYVKEM